VDEAQTNGREEQTGEAQPEREKFIADAAHERLLLNGVG